MWSSLGESLQILRMPEEPGCVCVYSPERSFTSSMCYANLQLGWVYIEEWPPEIAQQTDSDFNSFTPKAHLSDLPPRSSSSQ